MTPRHDAAHRTAQRSSASLGPITDAARRRWHAAFLKLHRRLDGVMTAPELLLGVALARRYGRSRGPFGRPPRGWELADAAGSPADVYRRIAGHPAADSSVWIALLRAADSAAEAALATIDRPHHDVAFRRALLRTCRPSWSLLLRHALHARGAEFERVARRIVRHLDWLATFNGPFAADALGQLREMCDAQIRDTPRHLWASLLHAHDAEVRLSAIRITGMARAREDARRVSAGDPSSR